ncbi:MAG: CCA tRNA nucleotidyltransferase [Oligoflexus sp.]|nr:CCA tRNA nucleotidyltransferase [Oligoflexus sp.]
MNSSKSEQNDPYDQNTDQNYQVALKVMTILEDAGQQARMAGGCVRDRLLKRRPKDYDIATSAEPDIICSIFKQKGIKTVPTGIDHGTITVVIGGQGIELTSLRLDVATDGRRAVVSFGNSFQDDSLRRDFTINALYEDLGGKVYDFHSGLDDLKHGVLRFVGDARTRIREDYLRILRLFRFWARFGFEPQGDALLVIAEEVRGLEQISQERKTSELLLILECPDSQKVLAAMAKTGVLSQVLGISTYAELPKANWDALFLNNKARGAIVRLASLIMNFNKKEDQWTTIAMLKLSRQQSDAITILLDNLLPSQPDDPASAFDWLDRVESQLWDGVWDDFLLPSWTILKPDPRLSILNKTLLAHASRRVCTLNGQYFITHLKIKPGPELGTLLQDLKTAYRRGFWNTKEEALALAKRRYRSK